MRCQGVYADILHISDLQLAPDAITSALLEISGMQEGHLATLWDDYIQWCGDNSPWPQVSL